MTVKRELLWASDWSTIPYLVSIFLRLPCRAKALILSGRQGPTFSVVKQSPGGVNHGHGRYKSVTVTISRLHAKPTMELITPTLNLLHCNTIGGGSMGALPPLI